MSDFFKKVSKKLGKLTAEQLKALLASAADRKSLLETVLDSLPDGILVCDDRHCLIMANKCARRMFPLGHIDSEKIPLWMAVRDERVVEFFEETLLSGDKVLEREIDIDIQGRSRLLSVSILPMVQEHRITGSLIYLEDITEKRSREARLRQVENLASLTTMAAGVAHEIKNPLGSISIHLQLMQKAIDKNPHFSSGDTNVKTHLEKYISVLNEEVDRLNHIVVDFLFAVRPVSLDLREGNINALITELAEFVRGELAAAKITCALELDSAIPPVMIDERYMKQTLLNLIKNAQAAMKSGGVITIQTVRGENEIKISVGDTGAGISAENIPKIFEPYFTTRDTGTGLGLTIVFKIIREHRGEITVRSREGEGSCFTITLPVMQKQQRLIAWESAGVSANAEVSANAQQAGREADNEL